MDIVSWNVNGIRACVKKGNFFEYLETYNPDILCVQEIKATVDQLEDHVLNPTGYHSAWFPAQRPGYSGVAIFSKHKPINVVEGFGVERFDAEGRVLSMEFDNFIVFSVYFPNGQMNEDRLAYKLDFYEKFFEYCNDLRDQGKHLIITGDYNTAHTEIDLANPKQNETVSGFLPIEREWLDTIIDEYNYVDTFREFNSEPEQYSWWTYRFGARSRNVGWRIDYCFVDKAFLPKVKNAYINQEVMGSDHCPVGVTISV